MLVLPATQRRQSRNERQIEFDIGQWSVEVFLLLAADFYYMANTEIVYDSTAIQKILPHRYPFLLVDKIVELEPRIRIVGVKQVTANEQFFVGHFPGAPVMPGVLQIEALAQVGAILALREFEDRDAKIPFFSGIENARFRKPVVPGDTLMLEVTALRVGTKIQRMKGVATVDGNVTAEAEIMSVIADRPANL